MELVAAGGAIAQFLASHAAIITRGIEISEDYCRTAARSLQQSVLPLEVA
jgi:hypothetical protein